MGVLGVFGVERVFVGRLLVVVLFFFIGFLF